MDGVAAAREAHTSPCQALNDLKAEVAAVKADVHNLIGWQEGQNHQIERLANQSQDTAQAVTALPTLVEVKVNTAARAIADDVAATLKEHECKSKEQRNEDQQAAKDRREQAAKAEKERDQRVYALLGLSLTASVIKILPPELVEFAGKVFRIVFGLGG